MVLRFGNGIFEPLWNRNYVDHVQITAAETLGVEQRAAFYETAGATRDMIQSHVLQLTSLVAMEPPAAFDATAVRNEKIKVLQSIRPFNPQSIADATLCAASTAREWILKRLRRSRATARNRAWPRDPRLKPSWPPACKSITGAGPACRFICAPESACPGE